MSHNRPFVPLWCKSNFSFLEGASHPEELVSEAARLGYAALGLCDRDGVYGVVKAHVACQAEGLQLIVGAEIMLEDERSLLLLCMDREGYTHLCRLISQGRLRSDKGQSRVSHAELLAQHEGLIAILLETSFPDVCAAPITRTPGVDHHFVAALAERFGDRLYLGISRHFRAEETRIEPRLRAIAAAHALPLVATPEVLYHHKARRPLHDVLSCIRHGVALSESGACTKPNAEYALQPAHVWAKLYADAPELLAQSHAIAQRCSFSLQQIKYRYPSEQLPSGLTSMQWLRQCVERGAQERYGADWKDRHEEHALIEKELSLIERLEYPGYFLTMYEIVQFCRSHGILCQGRGSAANSIVCYCLGITSVDPVAMKLLFERFISLERAEPPDIDLDIAHARREEVIQHVYRKYGRTHAAMVANVIRYRSRSALRDVGKVLGFSEVALDRMSKLLTYFDDLSEPPKELVDLSNPLHAQLIALSRELLDFPRHLSIHPGGFLLGHAPIDTLVPIENASMPDRTVIQWDKRDVEALGLFKVDLLGLGALTQLDLCFKLLAKHRALSLSMATIPSDDANTYAMLQRADTVGVFQIESRAQMSMLPRLKPKNFYDLVIEVSIVRPGPITGGMVHPYLRRRNGEEAVTYAHPLLEPLLDKTLGIPLFQEQVMKLAVIAADYTPGEADQLRRDMAAWRSSGKIEQHRDKLISRMQRKGIAREFAERVFAQIRGFGEYGFPESHAASFALICYATAWMRRNHLDVFTCALLNAQPMGFYSPATIIEDAKRHGLGFLPVDVRVSEWDCTLEPQAGKRFAVRMGLRYIKGLAVATLPELKRFATSPATEAGLAQAIATSRLDKGTLQALAEADAFASFGVDRRQALWRGLASAAPQTSAASHAGLALGEDAPVEFSPLSKLAAIQWDHDATGHTTRGHVLGALRGILRAQKLPTAKEVALLPDGARVRYAGLVICRQRPATAAGVTFMTLEDETGFVNLVIWQRTFETFNTIAKTVSFLGASGRVQNDGNTVHVVVDKLWQPQHALQQELPLQAKSRDFH